MRKMKDEKILETIQELEALKRESKDYIIPNDSLSMKYNEYTNRYILEADTPDGVKELIPSPIAFQQICEKMGIPRTYVKRCQENSRDNLLITNINDWLNDPANFLIRTRNNTLRAFLSDRFRLIDNYDIAMLFLKVRQQLKERGIDIEITDIRLSETNMYIKSMSPQLLSEIIPDKEKPEKNDIVNGGIVISNSDIGKGRFSVKNYIEILRCANGMIGEHEFSRIHIGKKLDEGEIRWSEHTQDLQSETFWSQAQDMMTNAFTQEIFQRWVDKINGEASLTIDKPIEAIDNVVKEYHLNESDRDNLLSEFSKQGYNKWSLANAVNQVAQYKDNYDDQIEMEKISTAIMNAPLKKFVSED